MYRTVASYLDPLEAHIVCGRLQAEGFAAHVADDQTNIANWEWRTAIGGTRVRVHADAYARARALTAEPGGGAFARVDEEGHPPADGTPLHPDRETWSSRLALLFGLGLGIPLPWRRREDEHEDKGSVEA